MKTFATVAVLAVALANSATMAAAEITIPTSGEFDPSMSLTGNAVCDDFLNKEFNNNIKVSKDIVPTKPDELEAFACDIGRQMISVMNDKKSEAPEPCPSLIETAVQIMEHKVDALTCPPTTTGIIAMAGLSTLAFFLFGGVLYKGAVEISDMRKARRAAKAAELANAQQGEFAQAYVVEDSQVAGAKV
jgi:hypothetical protein